MHRFVREEQLEHGHRLVDVSVRNDPDATAVMLVVDDGMVEPGVVRHRAKPPRVPEDGPGRLLTT
jgi:hypothetical protein